MQRYYIQILCLIIITILNSCEADFNVTAPYKETTVVYGLLDAADSVQWVRINKTFLGEGDAYVMAQQPDSTNFPDILDVKLEAYNTAGTLIQTLMLKRDSSIQLEPGIFASSPNILYRTKPGEVIKQENKYKLVIYNRESGKTVTALTNVVDEMFINYPYQGIQFNWFNEGEDPNKYVQIKWATVPEGVVYQLTIRFHYDESNVTNPSDTVHKYIDWVFPEITTGSGQSQNLSLQIQGNDFYKYISDNIKPENNIIRKIGHLDFNFTVGAEEFNTYIVVNQPPTGANQNIPQFTNIDGGIGIFSSRLNQSVKNIDMNTNCENLLRNLGLGFY
ncbi:MAG: hypothetical protein ABIT08_13540 [Bacteroidia bacterium]